MRTHFTTLALLLTLTFAPHAQAQGPNDTDAADQIQPRTSETVALQKDPVIAMYLSATVPGLGQIYVGDKKRGFLFLASIVGAFGAAYASYEPARLHLADYDRSAYGGNGDGLLSTAEAQNWEERRFEDDAFEQLTTGRKAGVIAGAAAGAALYIWNVLDARTRAHDHNRQVTPRRTSVRLEAGPHRAGFAMDVNF